MNVVIIEDEKVSAEHLALLLYQIDASIKVIQFLDSVEASIEALRNGLEADLLFVDIHLSDGNSFEIFTTINNTIPLVFTTAFDNYAIQAFKQNSVDYLLKPIQYNDLKSAIEKFQRFNKTTVSSHLIETIANNYNSQNQTFKNRFLVKKGQLLDSVSIDLVHHFEIKDSLSFLVNLKSNRYTLEYTLDELESILDPKLFFRINRKTIIHIQIIQKIATYFNGRLIITADFIESENCIVSRERVSAFKKWLDN
jgi:DNA-binding LytR/AlgR family response regulator